MTAPNTDARRFEAYLASLAQKVKTLEEASKQPQLGYSSLDDRNMVVTVGGEVRQVWGVQPGGTVGVANFNGPPPPRPNTPDVTGVLGGLNVAWNGELAGELPADFSHITVHAYFVDGFAWSEDNRVGTLFSKGSLIVAPLEVAPHYVRFVAWNTSGKPSEPSYQASGVPLSAVSDETLAGIRSELASAARDAAQVEVAGATIGRGQIANQAIDTSKLADGSVSAAQLVDGAVTVAKVAFSAREIGAMATFYQAAAPAGAAEGDTWADSDDGAKLYRYTAGAWVLIQDSATALAAATTAQTNAANALAAAASADAKADGKVTVFYQGAAPATGVSHLGDLWLDTSAGNRLSRYNGTTWALVDDARLAAALAAAATAQSTADGKIDSYYAATAPPAAGLGVGDLWFNTSQGNRTARWDGSQWVNLPIGAPAISASAVTTEKLSADAVTAEKIVALAIGTRELAANSVVAGKIAAEAITAEKLAATSVTAEKIAALAVSADKIAAQAITADKIAALAVTADAIAANAITASKITAGAINATHLTTSLLLASQITVGSPGGARLELEGRGGQAPGLRLYNSSGIVTLIADAATGDVSLRGEIRTSDSGQRIIIRESSSNDIRFYPSVGTLYGSLYSFSQTISGVQYGSVRLQGPAYNNRASYVWALADAVYIGRSGLNGATDQGFVYCTQTSAALAFGAYTGYVQAENNKVSMYAGNSPGLNLTANGSYPYAMLGSGIFTAIRFEPVALNVVDASAPGTYRGINASNFGTMTSSRRSKTAIEPLPWDPEEVIAGAPAAVWERRAEQRDAHGRRVKARKHMGPMSDDLPELLKVYTESAPDDPGVDLGAQIAVVWEATGAQTRRQREQADHLAVIDARLAALEGAA